MKPDQSAGMPRFRELEAEYEIIGELGRGGTAVVYRARERELGRDVAIKVVRSNDDAEAAARLAREAKLVAALRHPNVVPLLGIKHLAEGIALVMQHVPGRTLKQAIRQDGQLPIPFVEHVLREIASALDYAHKRHGIVHRDIKPENIYLDEEVGRALLSDFGIARIAEGESTLTLVGTALGTPAYMSPEQIDGSQLDGRSDLYSLGLVAYEMLTGQQPWAGHNLYTIIYKQKNEDLPPVTHFRQDVPSYLQRALDSLLRKDVALRCPDAAHFIALLPGAPVAAPTFAPAPRTPEPLQPAVSDDSPTLRYQRPAIVEEPVVEAPVVAPAEPIAPWPAPAETPAAREPDPALAAVAAAMAAVGPTAEPAESEEVPVLELPTVRPNWRRVGTRNRAGVNSTAVYAHPEVTTVATTEQQVADLIATSEPATRQRNSRLVAALTLLLMLGASGAVVAMINGREKPAGDEVAESPATQQRNEATSLKASDAAPLLTAGTTARTPAAVNKPANTPNGRADSTTTAVAPLPVPNVQVPTLNPEPVRPRVSAADFTSAGVMPSNSNAREPSVVDQPSFTPYTVEPELRNRAAVQRALTDNYPRVLRERSIGGTVRLWVLIDTAGRVMRTEIQQTSGNDILDRAAARVANVMQFTPAMNRDKKVSVWIQLPINFRTQE